MKDTTAFINFVEKTKVGKDTTLISMNVSSLYTSIPQEEKNEEYEKFNNHNALIPTHYLREMLGLIFQENLFQFNEENFPDPNENGQCHLPIFPWRKLKRNQFNKAKPGQEIGNVTLKTFSPFWLRQRRSRWILNEVTISILVSNSRPKYQRTKSPSSIPQCLEERDLLKSKTHNKPTETFQFTHFASCHPPGVKHGFIKGEAMRLLRTNSPKEILEEGLLKFKQHLKARGYLQNIIERSLSRVNFASRQSALTHKQKPEGHNVPLGR